MRKFKTLPDYTKLIKPCIKFDPCDYTYIVTRRLQFF